MHLSHYIAPGLSHNHLTASIKKIKEYRNVVYLENQTKFDAFAHRILLLVSEEFNLSIDQLKSECRLSDYKTARHIAMYIIRKKYSMPIAKIGKLLNRDHSTISYSIRLVDDLLRFDKKFQSVYYPILEKCNV
jgi:chromosomal replication initiator protein